MNAPVKKIILIPNPRKEISPEKICSIISRLHHAGCDIGYYAEDGSSLPEFTHAVDDAGFSEADAALVLGGDGSIIEAVHKTMKYGIPVVGINFGHVGYLTEIEDGESDLLEKLAEGEYEIDRRMMLTAEITDCDGKTMADFTVLNDLVLTNGPVARLIKFDILSDENKIETCRADGLIVATPTGSTAYSLSAGGPVIDSRLECICLTPICPHTIGSRPIVISGNETVLVKNISSNGSSVYLNADGREVIKIENDYTVKIRKSKMYASLIRLKPLGFLGILEKKLSSSNHNAFE